jgi:UDP-N-acetylmuramate dehydrogenase
MDKTIAKIKKIEGITLLEHEPMSRHTTFRIGGSIRAFVYANTFDALKSLTRLLVSHGVEPLFVGNGSNLLVSDDSIDRIAICTMPGNANITPHITEQYGAIEASAGITLSQLAVYAAKRGLTGLEWAAGIPGTLGGAIMMNAGAFDGEMSKIVFQVETLERGSAATYIYDIGGDSEPDDIAEWLEDGNKLMEFSYRNCSLSNVDGLVISGATLMLESGDKDAIASQMRHYSRARKMRQPLEFPSAGCVFKNPERGFASQMIDQAGLKGYSVGGAQVSTAHAGFIVNTGGATCSDVLRVIEHVKSEVLRNSNVELQLEIKYVS